MSVSEFDLISRYFNQPGLTLSPSQANSNIALGIGDDCALLSVPDGHQLAVSMDVLVAGVHFPETANPGLIAQRALAVNISDLAAMGARPVGFTLALTLPKADPPWLESFSQGLSSSAQKYTCPLIGGDMSKGPLSVCIQVHGLVKVGKAICRNNAKPGDLVYVSGSLGEAGLALELIQGKSFDESLSAEDTLHLESAYFLPQPRIDLGLALSGLANSAIDISDGLLADLGHISQSSDVSITLHTEKIPISSLVKKIIGPEKALLMAISAGDDYELAFTIAPENISSFEAALMTITGETQETKVTCTCIGEVEKGAGLICLDQFGKLFEPVQKGYKHFR